MIDTRSAEVELRLAEMGRGNVDIDTGSGGITLTLPVSAGAEVEAESGSGGVKVDIAGVQQMRRADDDEVAFTVGDGAARVTLETSSGTIRIREN